MAQVKFTPELLRVIPAAVVQRYRVSPVFDDPSALRIAIAHPIDLDTLDGVSNVLQRELSFQIAEPS